MPGAGSERRAVSAEADRPLGRVPVGRSVTVEVPATSANLGPGFDCFGLALDWRDRCRLEVVERGWRAEVTGEGAGQLPTDERHLVLATARRALDHLGYEVPGLALHAHNTIPHGRGLGSSSAAIVAGLLGAAGLVGTEAAGDPAGWLQLATEIEGHPDNVAAALYGGFVLAFYPVATVAGGPLIAGQVLSSVTPDGTDRRPRVLAVPLAVHPDVRAVVFVPAEPLSTERARGLLPATVPHRDAAANSGRAALLVEALSRDPGLLFEATAEWLHQGYRASAMPRSAQLVRRLREHGLAAVISGAGPTVLMLGDARQTATAQSLGDDEFTTHELGIGVGGTSW